MSERVQHDEQCSSLHAEGLIYFGSKKKEPRYTCLRAAKAAPHLLHKGLLVSHNK